jgi:hypothetical protein
VALDGTKIKANASKHKAMSYERMEQRAVELEAEVAKWFAVAEATDAEEDKRYGADRRRQRRSLQNWKSCRRRALRQCLHGLNPRHHCIFFVHQRVSCVSWAFPEQGNTGRTSERKRRSNRTKSCCRADGDGEDERATIGRSDQRKETA